MHGLTHSKPCRGFRDNSVTGEMIRIFHNYLKNKGRMRKNFDCTLQKVTMSWSIKIWEIKSDIFNVYIYFLPLIHDLIKWCTLMWIF